MPLSWAAGLVLAAASSASAASTCETRFAGLCAALASDPRVMLSTAPAFIPNPARTGPEILGHRALRRRIARGEDAANLAGTIRPMFDSLVAVARGWASALPAGSPGARIFDKRFAALTVESVDRERCRDRSRPFVAGYNGDGVMICPWMTHLDPAVMLTVLGHELGHFLDPCWGQEGSTGPPPFPTLGPLPPTRGVDCSGDEEAFADLVGARLVDEVLHSGPPVPFPSDPNERFATFLYYTLQPQCQIAGNVRLTPFFAMPGIRAFLGCP